MTSVGSDCSPTERQLVPPSVDFQIPPSAVPRSIVFGSFGCMASVVARPLTSCPLARL
jgi:hypothetical protein